MKAEYVNPFYQATIQVFKLMLDLDLKRVLEADGADSQVIVQLSVSGDLTGTVPVIFPEKWPENGESERMSSTRATALVTSALAGSQISLSSKAMSNLSSRNFRCIISPPQVLTSPRSLNTVPTLRLPLETKWGQLILKALRETPKPERGLLIMVQPCCGKVSLNFV